MIQEQTPNIVEKINEDLKAERRSFAPRCNYASSAGHPCARKLVYDRLNWKEKSLFEPHAMLRMADGNALEASVIERLNKSGFKVVEQQRPMEWPELELSGRIEGQILMNGDKTNAILFEIKTMKHYDWEKISSAHDIKEHRSWWIRGYYSQFQLYLFLLNKEWGLFILKSLHGPMKQIRVDIDYEHAEQVAKKLELVNQCVKSKSYPDRIDDRDVCQMCDFKHVCLPDEGWDSLNIETDEEVTKKIERHQELKTIASEYEKLNEDLKKQWKDRKPGEYLFGNRFSVVLKEQNRTAYVIPPEIKAQYKETTVIITSKIVDIQNGNGRNNK